MITDKVRVAVTDMGFSVSSIQDRVDGCFVRTDDPRQLRPMYEFLENEGFDARLKADGVFVADTGYTGKSVSDGTAVKALRESKYGAGREKSYGPLQAVIVGLLAKYNILGAQVDYFHGVDGGYKITVHSVADTFKAEGLRKEVEGKYGIPVYVAY